MLVFINNSSFLFLFDKGYEGIIIRNIDGMYEFGFRSDNLIKLKVFDDKEFEIVESPGGKV